MLEGQAVLGGFILNDARENGVSGEFAGEVLSRRLISEYVRLTTADERLFEAARSVEDNARLSAGDLRGELCARFTAGFALAKERKLHVDDLEFSGTGEITALLNSLLRTDVLMFERLITRLTGVDGTLDPQFEAWLIALGRRDEVEKWKSSQEV